MTGSAAAFAGSIAAIYDTVFVPILFAPYAADLAERIAEEKPESVLETAAGTGALTNAMASRGCVLRTSEPKNILELAG
jgi:hypothetical protein